MPMPTSTTTISRSPAPAATAMAGTLSTTPLTPMKSGQELTQIINNLNDQFRLDIHNPQFYSPGANRGALDTPQWRTYHGLRRLYYDRTVDLNTVLNGFGEWVCSRGSSDTMLLWARGANGKGSGSITSRSRNSNASTSASVSFGGLASREVIAQREREERLSYLVKLIDDELYILGRGSFPAPGAAPAAALLEESETSPEEDLPVLTGRPLKRRLDEWNEYDDGEGGGDSSDEFQTAPNSPVKNFEGSRSDSMEREDSPHKALKTTRGILKSTSTFMERLTASTSSMPNNYRRYDAVRTSAQQNAANFSFSTLPDTSFAQDARRGRLETSFSSTVTSTTEAITEAITEDSGSAYDDSIVATHMLSEEVTNSLSRDFTLNGGSFEEPRYSAEGDIVAELLQSGPFSLDHSLPASVPLLYRYELERIGRAWNVPLNRMLAGDNISLRYDEFWKWIEGHSLRKGKPVPDKPTRKAWEASRGTFKTGKHPEAVVLTGDLDWCTKSEPGVLKLKLGPLKTERSCRFHRRFGSDRFLSLTIPAPARPPSHLRLPDHPALLRESIALWLTQNPHRCLGRTWKPFFVEEVKQKRKIRAEPRFRVDFFAIDGVDFLGLFGPSEFRAPAKDEDADAHTPMSLESLLEWHLSPSENSDQTNLKLFQRMSLGLSKTFATVTLKPRQVLYLKDPRNHKVMNDGCALMSRKLANMICDSLGITGNTPSAFQGRIAGAKGLWMVDAHQSEISAGGNDVWIQISDSQLKIKPHPREWREPVDDDKLTFEVVKWSKPLNPVDLNIQLLAILDHGGNVKDYIAHLARLGIQGVVRDFEEVLKQNSPTLCRSLAQKIRPTVESGTGFMAQNLRRLERWMTDDVEAIIRFSEAGFTPREFYPLRKRLGKCLRDQLERYVEEMRIEVPLSTYAFCIADPHGVLQEDEVHFGLSINWHDEQGQFEDNLLDGIDVLVGRLPAHLPSDIQRRRAVWKPELRHFKDVIVFPTTGDHPLADMLSGGDYDGDTPWICWDQNMVRKFHNSRPPSRNENCPPEYFGLTKHSVPMRDIHSMSEFLDSSFTFNLTLSNLGRCTVEHEKLSYDESIDSRNAKELSCLLSHLVDGRKAGVHLSETAWQQYRKKISPQVRNLPAYKNGDRKPKRGNIIDYIRFTVSRTERDEVLTKLEKAFPEAAYIQHMDQDLVQPWNEARRQAEADRHARGGNGGATSLASILKQTCREIDELQQRWNRSLSGGNGSFSPLAQGAAEQARAIPAPAAGDHPMIHVWRHRQAEWLELMASYAYKKQPRSSFVFHAFGEALCQIKSRSLPSRTVSNEILACYRVNKKVVARLKARDGEEGEESESGEYEGHEAIEAMYFGTTGVGGYYDPDDQLSVE
ncbi:RNA dependent RNA polymerase-domain-containing protein [Aspergillus pseudoustus]|uniref:RNA-dependent RNA polymerase n=1 Tax=Aspergillus pseudoustus TaxID=1810923 RepID=A0ABR4IST7_9EURO